MAEIILKNGSKLADFGTPFISAELNTSHFGNLDVAKSMVESAKALGCDGVKFQSWTAESLYSESYYKANPIGKRMFSRFSLGQPELEELSAFCSELKIAFSSTPYSNDEVDFLVDRCSPAYIKIASMDITNPYLLEHIGNKKIPTILSTGMATLAEIEAAVKTLTDSGCPALCLMHCVSIYPAAPGIVNLNNIRQLRSHFPQCPIGYSDHTLGASTAAAAVALGSCIIEKHFTLDKSKIGMDNQMASEPEELSQLVSICHEVHQSMGQYERVITEEDMNQRQQMRRSVIAVRDLPAGSTVGLSDLGLKRPGTGYAAGDIPKLVGRRLARAVQAEWQLDPEDFEGPNVPPAQQVT